MSIRLTVWGLEFDEAQRALPHAASMSTTNQDKVISVLLWEEDGPHLARIAQRLRDCSPDEVGVTTLCRALGEQVEL